MTTIPRPERVDPFCELLAQYPVGRLIDLGSGTAFTSLIARDAGWAVTSVDARTDRWPDPLPQDITWIENDVRRVPLDGYDLVVCCGLFYHLTFSDQMDLLSRLRSPMILDTHVGGTPTKHPVTPARHGAFDGVTYPEPDDSRPLSSWGNEESFWPTVASLASMAATHGLTMTTGPWTAEDRLFVQITEETAP